MQEDSSVGSESGDEGDLDHDSEGDDEDDDDDSEDDDEPLPKKSRRDNWSGKGGRSIVHAKMSAQEMATQAKMLAALAKKRECKELERRRKDEQTRRVKDKAIEKEQKATRKKVVGIAKSCKDKVAPHVSAFTEIAHDRDFLALPTIAQTRCTEMLAKMKAWDIEADAVVEDETRTKSALNLEAVLAACKDANLIRTSILSLRKTVGKF